ncbi:MAG: hypothetical protein HZB33_08425 [Nitrospirae bacterium]|nr:hypothetical protein [Nitrospirota bacterium]
MKKTIAILLTMIFVFAVTSVTFASDAKKEAAPAAAAKAEAKKEAAPVEKKDAKPAKKSAPQQATGEVAAVDAKAKTMTVKAPKKGDVTVSTDDKTKFMPAGKTIADVKAGDKVTVKYTETDGKNTAKSVEIKAAPAKKEEKKAAPAAAAPKAEEKKAAPAAPAAAAPKAEEKKAAPAKKAASGY